MIYIGGLYSLCCGKRSIYRLCRLSQLYVPTDVADGQTNLHTLGLNQDVSVHKGAMTVLSRRISSSHSIKEWSRWSQTSASRTLDLVNYAGSRSFGSSSEEAPFLSREWLVKLWQAEQKRPIMSRPKKEKAVLRSESLENVDNGGEDNPSMQPPISQPLTGSLKPKSPEEVILAPLLSRANLLITRDIEWANLMIGMEQENRYVIVDPCYSESPVGSIREKSNFIARQLLRGRRPLVASINDAMGNELFRVRRPFWFINSSIFVEVDGKEIGAVHRRWHLWRRMYDLYLGNEQFAVVDNPGLWFWDFTLKDKDDNVLAVISRGWRGFGFEILTDAGQYSIRFGNMDDECINGTGSEVQELKVSRLLTLSERAIALALAISLDNDYFSRHGGWGRSFFAFEE